MISDAFTRVSGTTGTSPVPQDLDPAAAATPLLSTNWIDMVEDSNMSYADGEAIFGVFAIATEDVASAAADATVEFQLITMPRTVAAGQTFTADAGTDVCTISGGDPLPDGTLVTASSTTALPGGLAASTHYYVIGSSTTAAGVNTFQLSTTPDGSAVNITTAGTGTHTLTHVPNVIASSGPVPIGRLRKSDVNAAGIPSSYGDKITVCSNPLPHSPNPPRHRYMFARYVVSDDLTAGQAFCDIGTSPAGQRTLYHRSGFVV